MNLKSLVNKIRPGKGAASKSGGMAAPVLREPLRFPYGPFRFRCDLPKGAPFAVQTCTDLRNWLTLQEGTCTTQPFEFLDTDAAKFSYRFYRLLIGANPSPNVLGYAAVSLPPGFAMIANPFESEVTVSDFFKDWPDGTTLSRFDTRLFRLAENGIKAGKWSNPSEKLLPGEGCIFYNPTQDYKSASFYGEVMQGNLSVPIPSGFSVRSSLVPQPGALADDLAFPIADGDVIHVFDREKQSYVLHPFEDGKWVSGQPVLSLGEAFWVAKTDPGNWTRYFVADSESNDATGTVSPPGA